MTRLPLRALATSLALTTALSAQVLHTVDDDGPADYSTIAGAVIASNDGDAILVRPGTYGALTILGKTVTVIGEPGASVSHVRISSLTSEQRVMLYGLTVADSVTLQVNDGPVWIEKCDIGPGALGGNPGLDIINSVKVTAIDTSIEGGTFYGGTASWALSGIRVLNSALWLYGGLVAGGAGDVKQYEDCFPSGSGASALGVEAGAWVYASGTEFQGGAGADAAGDIGAGGNGGAAVLLSEFNATLESISATFLGGSAGAGLGDCADGGPGSDIVNFVGATWTDFPEQTLRRVLVDGAVFEGGSTSVTVQGDAGDFVFGLYSAEPLGRLLPGISGALWPAPPQVITTLGALPSSGEVRFDLQVGQLPPGWGFAVQYLQTLHFETDDLVLGSPTALIILNAAT